MSTITCSIPLSLFRSVDQPSSLWLLLIACAPTFALTWPKTTSPPSVAGPGYRPPASCGEWSSRREPQVSSAGRRSPSQTLPGAAPADRLLVASCHRAAEASPRRPALVSHSSRAADEETESPAPPGHHPGDRISRDCGVIDTALASSCRQVACR